MISQGHSVCLAQNLNNDLLNKVPTLQLSDADIHRHRLHTGDAIKPAIKNNLPLRKETN
jgi:hypothetical protein